VLLEGVTAWRAGDSIPVWNFHSWRCWIGTSLKTQNQNGNRWRIRGLEAQSENQIYSSNDVNLRPRHLNVAHHLLIAMELGYAASAYVDRASRIGGRFNYWGSHTVTGSELGRI